MEHTVTLLYILCLLTMLLIVTLISKEYNKCNDNLLKLHKGIFTGNPMNRVSNKALIIDYADIPISAP